MAPRRRQARRDDAAQDVRGARRRAPARDGRDRAPRARDGRGRRRDVVARRDPRARALAISASDRSRRPDARADRRVRRSLARLRSSPRSASSSSASGSVEVPQSSIAGERELRFAYPNLWSIVYKGIDEARAPRAITRSSRAGSSCIPKAAARPRRKRSAVTSRSPATRARPRLRYRRAAEAARAQFANERAIRLFDRALACIGDAAITRRASTCGTTSARSTS